MATAVRSRVSRSSREGPIAEMTILWLSAGLSCDGETIAMTAASQPSIEDVLSGAIPWLPKVRLHNPFLSPENGDEFLDFFHQAAEDTLGPFILVVEGSIPDETNKEEGYWAAFGTDKETNQPITTCHWIDRLAPNAWAVVAVGTCAAYGGIHAMAGNPTGSMGLPDYLGWTWTSRCQHTSELRDWLDMRRADFTEFDVESDQDARQRMRAYVGMARTVPVLVEDGKVVQIGWQGRGCVVSG